MSSDLMDQFVLLYHVDEPSRGSHYDLMLEFDGVLTTWAVAGNLFEQPGVDQVGTQLPNHRKKYLDYEGPISEGRGSVTRIVRGNLNWVENSDTKAIVEIQFELETANIKTGRLELTWIDENQWTVCFIATKLDTGRSG